MREKYTVKRYTGTEYSRGNLTVEAALVMPVILYTIFLLIYFLLFLYNRGVMSDAALIAVNQTTYLEEESNLVIEKAVYKKCEESLRGRLVGMKDVKVTVSVGKFQSRVILEGSLNMAGFEGAGRERPFGKILVKAEAERLRPGQFLRNVRKGRRLKEWLSERKEENEGGIQTGLNPELPDFTEEE